VLVNGVNTNTIIAGTSGYVSVYGSCLSGATYASVGLPPGVTPLSSNFFDNGTQINVFFSSSATAQTGSHNITVTTPLGTSTSERSGGDGLGDAEKLYFHK
jgi:hypothetical protein